MGWDDHPSLELDDITYNNFTETNRAGLIVSISKVFVNGL